ncbi:MAG: cytochrome ubiquinol oxidase subunit I [Elusimicrobiota bacterium]|nr:cytochrome ubiquinol oxidase subunit I [Elusimicrobiota bacterium]
MYPVWEVPGLTAGGVLALIATFHILPSHLSVSAMWLSLYLENKAYREERPELLAFVRKYTGMLLVFAYVFGSITGVGIWFSASAAAPRALSGLIHNYVWGWATEWCFFLIEVAGIFTYYYTFDKVDRRTHLKLGWIFALGSWTTMIVIVGILTFMLTPGRWLVTGGFFDGFFNQTYWPQLALRTTGMFAIAASYAVAVASRSDDAKTRAEVVRIAAAWGLAGLALATASFFWYRAALPEAARATFEALLTPGLVKGMWVPIALMAAWFALLRVRPLAAGFPASLLAICVLFVSIFSFERARELIRKPYLMPGFMYSNQIIGHDLPAKGVGSETAAMNEKGILRFAPFVPNGLREVTDANRLEAGRMVALIECSSCHTLSPKGLRPLPQRVAALGFTDVDSLSAFLDSLGSYPYMPPFIGTEPEKQALAAYLISISK